MGGYFKSIAVIKGVKDGFSADGGSLAGVVKVEKYGLTLCVETSLINFAPLTEGKVVTGVSDGVKVIIFDGCNFQGEAGLDIEKGFCVLVCHVNGGQVYPLAEAESGGIRGEGTRIRTEIERQEVSAHAPQYEDEAIAEENYYEYRNVDKDGGTVCAHTPQEKGGEQPEQNEAAFGAVGKQAQGADFYKRMKVEIDNVLSRYPEETPLCKMIEQSKWVRITYGDGKYYVFGVIFADGEARYICYGVPAKKGSARPDSMANLASHLPVSESDGYWTMYQDAATGASVKTEIC